MHLIKGRGRATTITAWRDSSSALPVPATCDSRDWEKITITPNDQISGMEGESTDLAACSLLEMSQTFEVPLPWDYYNLPTSTLPEDPDRERTFCSDFVCCGQTLADLHALLQHYEESHVKLEDGGDDWPFGYGRYEGEPYGLRRGRRLVPVAVETHDSMIDAPSAFDTTVFRAVPTYASHPTSGYSGGMHYLHSTGPSHASHPSFPYGATANAAPSPAYQSSTYPYTPYAPYAPYALSALPNPHGKMHAPPKRPRSLPVNFATDPRAISTLKAMLPSMLSNGPPENSLRLVHTALSSTINPPRPASSSHSRKGSVMGKGSLNGNSSDEEGPDLARERPYVCRVEGCGKTYKNPNGLKYHTLHGHDRDGKDVVEKPHRCPFTGCAKRYKNPNGLKYHTLHGHPGQTPPNKVTASLNSIARLDGLEAAIIRAQALAAQNVSIRTSSQL